MVRHHQKLDPVELQNHVAYNNKYMLLLLLLLLVLLLLLLLLLFGCLARPIRWCANQYLCQYSSAKTKE